MKSYLIELSFMSEKVVGHGEDAPPLQYDNGLFAVGVFDGMGGAGGAICESEYGDCHTKAYVASRIVKQEIEELLIKRKELNTESIKLSIKERLKQEKKNHPPKTHSILRSKLVRDYPTTMAIVTLFKDNNNVTIDSYWAGDSHCYFWGKDGFYQISKDDLEEANDPMENLHNDSPLSNCICLDREFHINHISITMKRKPTVILAATDGCFGYYPSPMHFEKMLSKTLFEAKDVLDWQERIGKEIERVTGDDASLSLIGIGFKSFEQMKDSLLERSLRNVILPKARCKINNLMQLFSYKKKRRKVIIDTVEEWGEYKKSYMRFIKD